MRFKYIWCNRGRGTLNRKEQLRHRAVSCVSAAFLFYNSAPRRTCFVTIGDDKVLKVRRHFDNSGLPVCHYEDSRLYWQHQEGSRYSARCTDKMPLDKMPQDKMPRTKCQRTKCHTGKWHDIRTKCHPTSLTTFSCGILSGGICVYVCYTSSLVNKDVYIYILYVTFFSCGILSSGIMSGIPSAKPPRQRAGESERERGWGKESWRWLLPTFATLQYQYMRLLWSSPAVVNAICWRRTSPGSVLCSLLMQQKTSSSINQSH